MRASRQGMNPTIGVDLLEGSPGAALPCWRVQHTGTEQEYLVQRNGGVLGVLEHKQPGTSLVKEMRNEKSKKQRGRKQPGDGVMWKERGKGKGF